MTKEVANSRVSHAVLLQYRNAMHAFSVPDWQGDGKQGLNRECTHIAGLLQSHVSACTSATAERRRSLSLLGVVSTAHMGSVYSSVKALFFFSRCAPSRLRAVHYHLTSAGRGRKSRNNERCLHPLEKVSASSGSNLWATVTSQWIEFTHDT